MERKSGKIIIVAFVIFSVSVSFLITINAGPQLEDEKHNFLNITETYVDIDEAYTIYNVCNPTLLDYDSGMTMEYFGDSKYIKDLKILVEEQYQEIESVPVYSERNECETDFNTSWKLIYNVTRMEYLGEPVSCEFGNTDNERAYNVTRVVKPWSDPSSWVYSYETICINDYEPFHPEWGWGLQNITFYNTTCRSISFIEKYKNVTVNRTRWVEWDGTLEKRVSAKSPTCKRIKVYSKLDIVLGKRNIDHVPTFFGYNYKGYDWWNSSYTYKYPILSNGTVANLTFIINDSYGVDGYGLYTENVSGMYVYSDTSGPTGIISIANDTEELCWENGTSITGNCLDNLWEGTGHVAVWHFDQLSGSLANDSTLNAVNLTIEANATLETDAMFGTGSVAVGKSGRVIDSGTFFDNPPANGTIELWFKLDEEFSSADATTIQIINKGQSWGGVNTDYLQIYLSSADGHFTYTWDKDDTAYTIDSTTDVWNADQWYYIVMTWGTQMELWVNGTREGTNAHIGSTDNGNMCGFALGRTKLGDQSCDNDVTTMIQHNFDEIRILNRSMTASEIQQRWWNGVHVNNLTSLGNEEAYETAPTLEIALNSPSNNSEIGSPKNFTYTPTVRADVLYNCSLWTNASGGWTRKETNATAITHNSSNKISETFTSDGNYLWTISCWNSTGDNFATSNRTVVVDITKPLIIVSSPLNISYGNTSIWFNMTGNDTMNWAAVEIDDDGINHTLSNSSGNWNYYNNTLGNGDYKATFWANDSTGNMNTTTVYFTINYVLELNIMSPSNANHTNSSYPYIYIKPVSSIDSTISVEIYANYTRMFENMDAYLRSGPKSESHEDHGLWYWRTRGNATNWTSTELEIGKEPYHWSCPNGTEIATWTTGGSNKYMRFSIGDGTGNWSTPQTMYSPTAIINFAESPDGICYTCNATHCLGHVLSWHANVGMYVANVTISATNMTYDDTTEMLFNPEFGDQKGAATRAMKINDTHGLLSWVARSDSNLTSYHYEGMIINSSGWNSSIINITNATADKYYAQWYNLQTSDFTLYNGTVYSPAQHYSHITYNAGKYTAYKIFGIQNLSTDLTRWTQTESSYPWILNTTQYYILRAMKMIPDDDGNWWMLVTNQTWDYTSTAVDEELWIFFKKRGDISNEFEPYYKIADDPVANDYTWKGENGLSGYNFGTFNEGLVWQNSTIVANNTVIKIDLRDKIQDNQTVVWYARITDSDGNVNTSEHYQVIYQTSYEGGSDITSCTNVTSSGTYTLTADLENVNDFVCINISASNVTIDCNGHLISGNDTLGYSVSRKSKGILANNSLGTSNTIKDCRIKGFWEPIKLENSKYYNISNNTVYTTVPEPPSGPVDYGVRIDNSTNNVIEDNYFNHSNVGFGNYYNSDDNIIRRNSIVDTALFCFGSGGDSEQDNNTYEDNVCHNNQDDGLIFWNNTNLTMTNNTFIGNNQGLLFKYCENVSLINNTLGKIDISSNYGIYIYNCTDFNITGGTINTSANDYYIEAIGSDTVYFKNTNFTSRKVKFADTSWFRYSNETNGTIWLTSKVSGASTIYRELTTWNITEMKWNETNSSGSGITVTYNISGLNASSNFRVYNNSNEIRTLTTDASGVLDSFTIYLYGESEIRVTQYSIGQGPSITIASPTNTTYYSSPLWLNWSSPNNMSWAAYSLNGGTNNTNIYTLFEYSSRGTNIGGVDVNDTHIFVSDIGTDYISLYFKNGTYTGITWEFDPDGYTNNPMGLVTNGTIIWVASWSNNAIYAYYQNGTYTGEYIYMIDSPCTCTYGTGITKNDTHIWVTDGFHSSGQRVCMYKIINNTADCVKGYDTLATGHTYASGIATDNINIWITDNNNKIYKYNMDMSFNQTVYNFTGRERDDVGSISTNGSEFWITNDDTLKAYMYGSDFQIIQTKNNITFSPSAGANNIIIWANDTEGDMNYSQTYFTYKDFGSTTLNTSTGYANYSFSGTYYHEEIFNISIINSGALSISRFNVSVTNGTGSQLGLNTSNFTVTWNPLTIDSLNNQSILEVNITTAVTTLNTSYYGNITLTREDGASYNVSVKASYSTSGSGNVDIIFPSSIAISMLTSQTYQSTIIVNNTGNYNLTNCNASLITTLGSATFNISSFTVPIGQTNNTLMIYSSATAGSDASARVSITCDANPVGGTDSDEILVTIAVSSSGGGGTTPGGGGGIIVGGDCNFTVTPRAGFQGVGTPGEDIAPFTLTIYNKNISQRFYVRIDGEAKNYCSVDYKLQFDIPPFGTDEFTIRCKAPLNKTIGNVIVESNLGCSYGIPISIGPSTSILSDFSNIIKLFVSGEFASAYSSFTTLMTTVFILPIWVWIVIIIAIIAFLIFF